MITNSTPSSEQPPPSSPPNGLMLMCAHQFWAFDKAQLPARIAVSDTPSNLCTHILYFAARVENGKVAFAHGKDWKTEDGEVHYPKVLALREQNPKLKVILVVQIENPQRNDGARKERWPSQSSYTREHATGQLRRTKLTELSVSSPHSIVDKIIEFCRLNKADGIMLAERRELDPEEQPHLSAGQIPPLSPVLAIVAEMRHGVDAEATKTGNSRLILMASIPAPTLLTAADVITDNDAVLINNNVDFVWLRPNRGGPQLEINGGSGLRVLPGAASNSIAEVESALARGIIAQKVVMSIETSWKSYMLDNENNWHPANNGESSDLAGEVTDDDVLDWTLTTQQKGRDGTVGRVSYTELCLDTMRRPWTHTANLSDFSAEPYAARGKVWVRYDSPTSVANKAEYVRKRGIAGVAMTSLGFDDPHGFCGKRFPLTRAAHDALELGPIDGIEIPGAVARRCMSFGTPFSANSSAACEYEMICGYIPRTSFLDKEVDCVGMPLSSMQSCTAPNKSECYLNMAARKAVAARGGSLDGAWVTLADDKKNSIVMNCNSFTPFTSRTSNTRFYFYCSYNYLNESSVDVFECADGSEFRRKRLACVADY